jgi:iron complex outermembrane recepter protein
VWSIDNKTFKAYREVDGRLAWQATPALECAIVGQNLLHAHHPEFGAPTTRREAERVVYGKLLWRF